MPVDGMLDSLGVDKEMIAYDSFWLAIILIRIFLKAQLVLGFLLLFNRCANIENQYVISGNTMGTTYLVKIITSDNDYEMESIEKSIDSLLIQLNKQMSTWDPESEISQFNDWNSKVPFAVSDDFLNVVKKSITISENTGGLFDPTVYDLMSLWGFGPNPRSGFS
ncbi:MAG: hypothetical protein CM15mP87_01910 [Candidatus Neomarinimicrobiota bacterium]|nr:MAG: hypothetical protein CM15mP87_01910 [Candidatus Neomarinimicrobiota bacterium]